MDREGQRPKTQLLEGFRTIRRKAVKQLLSSREKQIGKIVSAIVIEPVCEISNTPFSWIRFRQIVEKRKM
jgi:hypothetical protein